MVDSPDINVGIRAHDDYVYDPQMEPETMAKVQAAVAYADAHPELFEKSALRGGDGIVIYDETGTLAIKRFHEPHERERLPSSPDRIVTPIAQYNALSVLNERVKELQHPEINIRLSHPYYADDRLLIMERVPSDAIPLGEFGKLHKNTLNDDALIAKSIGWFLLVLDEHAKYKMRDGNEYRKKLSDIDPMFHLDPADPNAEVLGTPEAFIMGRYGSDAPYFFTTMLDVSVNRGDTGTLASYERQKSLHEHVYVRLDTSGEDGGTGARWEGVIIDPIATPF